MDDKIQNYRQPLVTAASILLGFVLNFANTWVSKAFATGRVKELVMATALCCCSISLLVVLYRILNMDYPRDKAHTYYKKTLFIFISGLSIVFVSIVIVMIESYILYNA